MDNKFYLVLLHSIGISQKFLNYIFFDNENYKDFFEDLSLTNLKKYKIKEGTILKILENLKALKIDEIKEKLEKRSVKIVTIHDREYPNILKHIPNAPFLLYLRGEIGHEDKLAVVGSRNVSIYGKRAIGSIIPHISNHFTIVSGGALGCDTEAHKETINAGGKTICCIGTGIDLDYPTSNSKMYDYIAENGGGIISIFPIGTPGGKYTFPVRNEIVAGLSKGIIVVEAKEKSGSLITSRLALELNRDLFAIPGEAFKQNSEGTNSLIKKGEAKMTTCSKDILEEYGFGKSLAGKIQIPTFDNDLDRDIFTLLLSEPHISDDIAQKLETPISDLNMRLGLLEIKGIVKKATGGLYEVVI